MEHKKKKNDDRSDRNRFMLIATVLALVLIFGATLLSNMIVERERNDPFNMTASMIVSTNYAVAPLLMETSVAATEQFIKTRTVQP
jgi:hypothetical protein